MSGGTRAPRRIQLRRTKGWRMPEGAVNVARPSRWGNPFHIDEYRRLRPEDTESEVAARVVADYRDWLRGDYDDDPSVPPRPTDLSALRGRDLACWCRDYMPCHADVLLDLANRDDHR